MIDKSKFKNATGQLYLLGLFYETTGADKASVVYTLKEQDHEGYPSLHRLFLEESDPTEYQFAIKHLANWRHWETLAACKWFQPYVTRWRKELEIKLRAEAIARIHAESAAGGKSAFQAMRYLADAGWVSKGSTAPSRGRPSKAEIKDAADQLFQAKDDVDADFERIITDTAGTA